MMIEIETQRIDRISLARRAGVFADNSRGWTEVIVWLQQHVEAAP